VTVIAPPPMDRLVPIEPVVVYPPFDVLVVPYEVLPEELE
jgi:hypothetical protein